MALKASRFLNPKADLVFKRIFGDHEHLLMSFLNALMPLPKAFLAAQNLFHINWYQN